MKRNDTITVNLLNAFFLRVADFLYITILLLPNISIEYNPKSVTNLKLSMRKINSELEQTARRGAPGWPQTRNANTSHLR